MKINRENERKDKSILIFATLMIKKGFSILLHKEFTLSHQCKLLFKKKMLKICRFSIKFSYINFLPFSYY